jgi:hypothetical protein
MQRGTLAALGILVVLLVVWFAVSDDPPQYEEAPLTVEKVENLDRIELTPPSGDGSGESASGESAGDDAEQGGERAELISLEKRDDGWWLTQPVEAPVAEDVASKIDEQFGSTIETDALDIQSGSPREYGLDPASAVEVALYGGGSDSPAHRLMVGEQFEVEGTGAIRTFIKQPNSERIYRAQADFGALVRNSVDDFRSDQIVDLERDALSRLEWKHTDGPTIVLEKDGENWKMSSPEVDWELATDAVDGIVGALTDLSADEFADEKALGDIGLEPPRVRLTAETQEGATELLVGRVEDDSGEAAYYVKRGDEEFKYKIASYAGEQLVATLTDLRSKTPRTFDQESITEVRFAGEDRVVVRKEEGGWSLVRPEAEDSLNTSKLDSRLSTIASLTVTDFPEVSKSEAGLGAGADRLAFETEDDDAMILLGDTVDGESGGRYVKFGDSEEIYTVSSQTAGDLAPSVDELVGESQAGPAKGMPKGMPKGLPRKGMPGKAGPGGGGLNKAQKMKMMQQLKQKMRQRQ